MNPMLRVFAITLIASQILNPAFALAQSSGNTAQIANSSSQLDQTLKQAYPATDRSKWAILLAELAKLPKAQRQIKLQQLSDAEASLRGRFDDMNHVYELAQKKFEDDATVTQIVVPAGFMTVSALLAARALDTRARGGAIFFTIVAMASAYGTYINLDQIRVNRAELTARQLDLSVLSNALNAEADFVKLAKIYDSTAQ